MKSLDDEVRNIVATTLKNMPNEWRKAVIKEDCFITTVRSNTYSVSDSGLIPKDYILIDFTKRGMPTDIETYQRESIELHDTFQSIERWYEC